MKIFRIFIIIIILNVLLQPIYCCKPISSKHETKVIIQPEPGNSSFYKKYRNTFLSKQTNSAKKPNKTTLKAWKYMYEQGLLNNPEEIYEKYLKDYKE